MTAAETAGPRLLLLDGHSLAYRAFYALPVENFSTSTGQHTNAVYGFASMLINVVRDEAPTHIGVAFDVSRETFRTAEYPEYKATRSASPDEFAGQVDLIKQLLAALSIPVIEKRGFEADDVLATLAAQAGSDFDTLICTGDRDSLQLVTDHVTVLYPKKGVSDLDHMTPERVEEKHGVRPENYPDVAALVGETSDNLPGVPGVGPKTAVKWLKAHGDLEGILTAAPTMKGKAAAALAERVDQVRQNRRLNALVADLELPTGPQDLARVEPDMAVVDELFKALEFAALRDRLMAVFVPGEDTASAEQAVCTTTVDAEGLASWFEATRGEEVAVFVVGADLTAREPAPGIGFAAAGRDPVYTSLDAASVEVLHDVTSQPDRTWVTHDAKSMMHAVDGHGIRFACPPEDTALMAYLMDPDQRARELVDLAARHLFLELPELTGASAGQLDLGGDVGDYADGAGARAAAVLALAPVLREGVDKHEAGALYETMEMPLVGVLHKAENTGIAVNVTGLKELKSEFHDAAELLRTQAYEAIGGREVNLGSPKQLQDVLFNQLDMPKTKRTKTGYSTDADSLRDLQEKTGHEFLDCLLRHREVTKQLTTVEGLLTAVTGGRIHTRFSQTAAATGRLSSTDPNLQNIPVRTAEGRRIREVFISGDAFDGLLSADYSQIEMRIMAHLSGDEGLREAFQSGEDLHAYVGSRVFGVDPAEVSAEQRAKVKAMSYGLAYGLSSFGLSKQLRISDADARDLMDMYFARFDGVRQYLAGVVEEARKSEYTQTIFGRRRYLPGLTSSNRQRREMAERMALNAPIQGSAADIMKVAMLALDEQLTSKGLASRLLLQVHDEVIIEVAPGERDVVTGVVEDAMRGAATLSVPLDVATGWGRTWHDAAH